jgi:hypothetical protein
VVDIAFDGLGQGSKDKPIQPVSISTRDMTPLDGLTDVGWLDDELKEQMKPIFLQKYGQYFDCGIRVTRAQVGL